MDRDRWQRVERVFQTALEQPSGERRTFIESVCGSDTALRDEVLALLAHDGNDSARLGQPVAAIARALATASVQSHIGELVDVYRIEQWLGRGGMGEVYRARDTKLGRDVALKFLPASFTADPERFARFRREAQILASLNHPSIGAIYGLEQVDDRHFLVLELVDGGSLADRLKKGGLAVDEVLTLAGQIAEGLAAAHEKGIIHCDFKPANIGLTKDGLVKILDFGLARASDVPDSSPSPADAPSLTWRTATTEARVIFGTVGYMSPEQAKGNAADKRTDVWAFGCVLYEMLTGKRATDAADTLAAGPMSEPDWTLLPSGTPPLLRILIERCLATERRLRIADLSVARFVLAEASKFAESVHTTPRPLWKRAMPLTAAVVLTGVLVGAAGWSFRSANPPLTVTRLAITLPPGQEFTEDGQRVIAISRDGTQIVYVANRRLFLRSMAEVEARAIPGSETTEGFLLDPVFSPDGRSIAFWSGTSPDSGALKKIAVTGGGSAVTICQTMVPLGMSWDAERILFARSDGILRIAEKGGQPQLLVGVKDGLAWRPQKLPAGDAVLFTLADRSAVSGGPAAWDAARIVVHSLKTGERTTLPQRGTDASYLSTGHVLYVSGGTLFALPFDASRRQVTGGPVPVIEGIRRPSGPPTPGTAYYSVSDTGSLIFVSGPQSLAPVAQDLAVVDRKGNVERLHLRPGEYRVPRVAPDGKRLAVEVGDVRNSNIWIHDLTNAASPQQLTFGGRNGSPVWSHDGERLLFESDREGDLAIFSQRADGSRTPDRLTRPDKGVSHVPLSWSRDGRTVLFDAVLTNESPTGPGESYSLSILWLPDRRVEPFGDVQYSAAATNAEFSPDDHWVAYNVVEPQLGPSVYVQPFPPTGAKRLVTKGGFAPMWSPNGRELFVGGQPGVLRVERVLRTQPSFTLGSPTEQPRPGFIALLNARNFDIMPDGRIIGVVNIGEPPASAPAAPQIEVVLNWFEELKARVPPQ